MNKYFGLTFLACAITLGTVSATVPNDTLVILGNAEIAVSLDPALAYDADSGGFLENIYESLVGYDGKSLKTLKPVLATDWKTSKDKKSISFNLRQGVKFQSGNTMNCQDAEYSFRRVLVTNNAGSAAWFLAEALLGTSSNANDDKSVTWEAISNAIKCNSKGQLVFTLTKVNPAFVAMTAHTVGSILERKYAVDNGEWSGTEKDWKGWVGKDLSQGFLNTNTNGTGAYKVVSIKPDAALFTAFKDYWAGTPKISKVLMQKVDSEDNRILALNKGDADLAGVRRVLLDQLKDNVNVVDDLQNLATDFVIMNQKIGDTAELGSGQLDGKGIPATFFSDLHVRKCFAATYDVNLIIKENLLGKGKARTMALPEGFLGYDPTIKTVPFNLELATKECKLAWKGAVWKNGFTLKAEYFGSRVPTTFQIIAANLAKINPKFRLEVQRIQSSDYEKLQSGKGAIFFGAWYPDYLDSDNYIYANYHSNGYQSSFSNFSDKSIDTMIEKAQNTTSTQLRESLYKRIGRRGAELVPYILLAEGANYAPVSKALKGYEENYNPMRNGQVLWKSLSK